MRLGRWRRRREAELEEEIRSHLDMAMRDRMERGESATQAAAAARREFGNVGLVKEVTREMWGWAWLEQLVQDARYGARMLGKTPGFTAVAVLTLALGIGANTAIFSLIDAVLLRMLPVQRPGELVELGRISKIASFSYPIFEQFRDRNQVFSGMLSVSNTPLRLTGEDEVETATGQYVSGNFFSLLGVGAWVGRAIIPEDDRLSDGTGSPVAVISYGLWQRRFGGDPSIVGGQILVEEKPFTIIGVAPPEFFGLQIGRTPDFWIPMATEPLVRPKSWLREGDFNWLSVVGRLKPGITAEQAHANLEVIFQQFLNDRAPQIKGEHNRQAWLSQKITVAPAGNGLSQLRRQFSKPLLILMTLVGLVLLIACANLANLLLARAASRGRELAVRLALGASRSRLIRQLLTESVLLALMGGAAGLLFAFWSSSFLLTFMSGGETPVVLQIRPDSHILAFTIAVSLLTGILFGLAPAFRATRVEVSPALKENARALGGGRPGVALGKALVVSQVALSLVLVIGAGLFIGSLRNLKTLDAGFDRENVLQANVNPGKAGYQGARLANFYQQVLDRVERLPGVRSASWSWFTPIAGGGVDLTASVEGYAPQPNEDPTVYVNSVSPGYFQTTATPILLGRDFSQRDTPQTIPVALINERMMNHYFRGANPIGRRVSLGDRGPLEIIGVVKDAKYMSLREETQRTVYLNCMQAANMSNALTLAVRTNGDPSGMLKVLRHEVRAVADNVPATNFGTLARQVDRSLLQERLVATLSGFFGALALLLACIGLYGVMSYSVAQRTNEIGIRMALGARRGDMMRMVLRESLRPVTLGVALGAAVALAAARLAASQISGLLFGLSTTDARTIAVAVLLMVAVAGLASFLPARRASRVDPMVAMRCE